MNDPTMGWALSLAAQATRDIAPVETLAFPGLVTNTFIGTPGEIQGDPLDHASKGPEVHLHRRQVPLRD